ncbi:pyridoxine kinase [Stenotrophomonas koreensis]|uniref:pyridoxal kinase n=1 Tax=Stenotrophomonas koreensis TaxID=266128 RepID=A0A0R0BWA5_9GAMM|nr:pyridoxal kinase [Stenotrophomonas koreensis]KRG57911.1 pyridoxine kinase [Stenotrophomonas koreensis]
MDKPSESHLVHGRRVRPEGPSPVDVITVQSQLVYGHAGNSAAVPPLRALGLRVAEVPTTLLSNAPFYSTLRGRMLPADWLAELLQGASERGLPERARALVSGYFGTVDNGQVFAQWARQALADNPALDYWLDPVIGDTHTGPYVEPALEAVFREQLLPLATVVTPNAFELGRLTGRDALAQDDAIAAARELLQRGPRWVIAHSVQGEPGQLVTLAVSADEVWRWSSEHLPVDVAGTGDVLLALAMAFVLRGEPMPMAISRAIAGVHAALEATLAAGVEEFDVLSAAPAAQLPPGRFRGQRLA